MRSALVPIREANVKAAIGEVEKLPIFEGELERLRAEVASEHYDDFPVEFRLMDMDIDGWLKIKDQASGLNLNFSYTKHALTQAVARIKPDGVVGMAGYLAVCPPELRALNFNYWHTDRFGGEDETVKGNNVLLRVKIQDNYPLLRAVVSQLYVPIDDVPVLTALRGIIRDGGHVRSVRGDIRSRFDLLWPTTQQKLEVGEPIFLALRVINSETGASSVRLEPMIFHMNTNSYLMIPRAGRDVPIRHIGEARNRLEVEYGRVMEFVDPFIDRLNAAYRDDISLSFNTIDQMWEAVGKRYELGDAKLATIKAAWQALGAKDTTRGYISQAIAYAAQQLDLDAAEEMQEVAGKLIRDNAAAIERYKDL